MPGVFCLCHKCHIIMLMMTKNVLSAQHCLTCMHTGSTKPSLRRIYMFKQYGVVIFGLVPQQSQMIEKMKHFHSFVWLGKNARNMSIWNAIQTEYFITYIYIRILGYFQLKQQQNEIWPVTYLKILHIWCWYVNIVKRKTKYYAPHGRQKKQHNFSALCVQMWWNIPNSKNGFEHMCICSWIAFCVDLFGAYNKVAGSSIRYHMLNTFSPSYFTFAFF